MAGPTVPWDPGSSGTPSESLTTLAWCQLLLSVSDALVGPDCQTHQ